jgi:raffinose/stachyose/melibiose transport system permease protein
LSRYSQNPLFDRLHPLFYALPAIILYSLFFLLPILLNFGFAFTNWTVFHKAIQFVWIDNFRELLKELRLLLVLKNTLIFSVTVSVFQNLFGFLLALALEERTKLTAFFRAVIFFPCLVSMVAWGQLFTSILDPKGVLNAVISAVLSGNIAVPWLGSRLFTIFVVAFVNVWVWTGFTMMIYITSLNTIPAEIIDAAKIDGVGWLGKIRHVVIPLIMPGITLNVIISLVGSMKEFDVVTVLTKGGPGRSTEVFNTLIYEKIGAGLFGYASALNLLLIVLIAMLAFPLYRRMSRRVVEL